MSVALTKTENGNYHFGPATQYLLFYLLSMLAILWTIRGLSFNLLVDDVKNILCYYSPITELIGNCHMWAAHSTLLGICGEQQTKFRCGNNSRLDEHINATD